MRLLASLERFSTSGLVETAERFSDNGLLVATALDLVGRRPARCALLVDYPDVNFILGPALARAGTPVLYLLPPQVWAWRAGRVRRMKRFVDTVAVAFPFEREIYERAGLRVSFIGHPLGLLGPYVHAPLRPPRGDPPVLALLPGSRPHEVRHVLPAMLATARLLGAPRELVRLRLARSPAVDDRVYDSLIRESGLERIRSIRSRDVAPDSTIAARTLQGASAALAFAGTATLEAALLGVPTVVVARLDRLSWEVARRMVDVHYVAMPSILLERRVFTERVQDEVRPSLLASDVERAIQSEIELRRTREATDQLRSLLFRPDTGVRFARLLLELVEG